jgi:ABC-2 type transport system ATP-binding protein
MAMIEVDDLRKDYGSFRALDGVSFAVDRGEILGFLGPNGAGKTTTMKILTGFLYPSSGKATVAGHDVMENSVEVRRRIGYLPEHTPLYEDMTVTEYLRTCGRLRGMSGPHLAQRMSVVTGLTHLGPKLRAPIHTLSKGYRQRVGLAQALLHEPEIIILDEPTVGLDPNQVVDVRSIVREVGQDRTVILCSHILSEVEAVCGRVVIINRGRIVANGAPSALALEHGGAPRLEVRVRGSAAALTAALAGLAHAASAASFTEAGDSALVAITCTGDPAELADKVVCAVRSAGLPLLALEPSHASLEDVFRRLTGRQGDAA